jgi:hypothetical protein
MNLITKQPIYTIDFTESELIDIAALLDRIVSSGYRLSERENSIRDELSELLRVQF